MSESRRKILRFTLALACAASCAAAQAEAAFPNKPLTLYVAFAPGGAGDIVARLVTRKMSESMGQAFVIENRPSPVVAVQTVQRAKPDGYTMVMAGSGTALTTALFKKLPYDLMKDFTHVAPMASFDLVLITGTPPRFNSVADVLAYAKTNPGKLTIGSARVGSTQHLTAEMFKAMTGIDALIVPFKTSGEILTALRSGDVDVAFEIVPPVLGQIGSNAVRALAVTSSTRFAALPQVPTVAESGVAGFESMSWNGISAPAGTPPEVIDRLSKEIQATVASPAVRHQLEAVGMVAQSGTPAQMTERMRADIAKWSAVITKAGIEKQ